MMKKTVLVTLLVFGITVMACASGTSESRYNSAVAKDIINGVDGAFENFTTNEVELNSIQGTWRHTKNFAPNPESASFYVFTGNEYINNNIFGGITTTTTGTFKINDNILVLIDSNGELFGILHCFFTKKGYLNLSVNERELSDFRQNLRKSGKDYTNGQFEKIN